MFHLFLLHVSEFDKNLIDTNSSQPAHWNVRHYPLGTNIDPAIWSSPEEVSAINNRRGASRYGEPISFPTFRGVPDHIPFKPKRTRGR